MKPKHLYILWTNADPVTADKMVFMYAINALAHGWWDEITLVVWGATAELVAGDAGIQERVREALDVGVDVSACKACADQLGVSEALESLQVEVKYWGLPLTELLKKGERLLTV